MVVSDTTCSGQTGSSSVSRTVSQSLSRWRRVERADMEADPLATHVCRRETISGALYVPVPTSMAR